MSALNNDSYQDIPSLHRQLSVGGPNALLLSPPAPGALRWSARALQFSADDTNVVMLGYFASPDDAVSTFNKLRSTQQPGRPAPPADPATRAQSSGAVPAIYPPGSSSPRASRLGSHQGAGPVPLGSGPDPHPSSSFFGVQPLPSLSSLGSLDGVHLPTLGSTGKGQTPSAAVLQSLSLLPPLSQAQMAALTSMATLPCLGSIPPPGQQLDDGSLRQQRGSPVRTWGPGLLPGRPPLPSQNSAQGLLALHAAGTAGGPPPVPHAMPNEYPPHDSDPSLKAPTSAAPTDIRPGPPLQPATLSNPSQGLLSLLAHQGCAPTVHAVSPKEVTPVLPDAAPLDVLPGGAAMRNPQFGRGAPQPGAKADAVLAANGNPATKPPPPHKRLTVEVSSSSTVGPAELVTPRSAGTTPTPMSGERKRSAGTPKTPAKRRKSEGKTEGKSSQYRGVYWDKRASKWTAQVTAKYQTHFLGAFLNQDDAARAYDAAALRLHGGNARLNFSAAESNNSALQQCLEQVLQTGCKRKSRGVHSSNGTSPAHLKPAPPPAVTSAADPDYNGCE